MRTARSTLGPAIAGLVLARAAIATPVSDFQARLAQTVWSAQQTEAILRSLPQTSSSVSVPDGLASYATLLSENAAALTSVATARELSDADRKTVGGGLGLVATLLRDLSALASNRGLSGALPLAASEQACRSAMLQLSAAAPRR